MTEILTQRDFIDIFLGTMSTSRRKKQPAKPKAVKYQKPTLKRLGNLRQITFLS